MLRASVAGRSSPGTSVPLRARLAPQSDWIFVSALLSAVWSRMRLRFTGPALAMSLLIFGCASSAPQSASSDRIWQAQLLRQQQAVRDQGRIGYIGYEGPSSRANIASYGWTSYAPRAAADRWLIVDGAGGVRIAVSAFWRRGRSRSCRQLPDEDSPWTHAPRSCHFCLVEMSWRGLSVLCHESCRTHCGGATKR